MGAEVVDVQATGSIQVYPEAVADGDVDTAVVNLRFASGAIGSVELSRRIAYGEDVRTRSTARTGVPSSAACRSSTGLASAARADPVGSTRPSTPRFAAA